jgi:hypothetical protein
MLGKVQKLGAHGRNWATLGDLDPPSRPVHPHQSIGAIDPEIQEHANLMRDHTYEVRMYNTCTVYMYETI